MTDIPEPLASRLLVKGRNWLSKWSIAYEWVAINKKSFLKELQHAPLQIVIPGHAILSFYCPADVVKYFDSYEPFVKETNYPNIQDALKIILTKKTMSNAIFVKSTNSAEAGFYLPAMSEESLKDKAKNFGLDILKLDGSIDYSKAKPITL